MRKILSIVLVALMVSMMIPAMGLAEDAATPEINYEELAAGETFTVEVESSSESVTIAVNSQLFTIEGGTIDTAKNISSIVATVSGGKASATVTVNAQVPAVVEASRIKITDGSTVTYQYASIADRLYGDADGSRTVDEADATIILKKLVGLVGEDETFITAAAYATDDTTLDEADATEILKKLVGLADANSRVNTYMGAGFTGTVEDPFEGSDEPVEPETTTLEPVTELYAYYQNNTIYYAFEASANADANTTYTITVGEKVETVTALTGSFAYDADYVEGLEISVVASSTTENYVASSAATTDVIEADASGALAAWLAENGLEDVAITVHEIK